jgi:hypothetical protein
MVVPITMAIAMTGPSTRCKECFECITKEQFLEKEKAS